MGSEAAAEAVAPREGPGEASEEAEATDEALMAAYVAGDQRAFDLLFQRYATRLYHVIRRQVRAEEDARELVQQTFLQLHRARHDFRVDAKLRPWLFTIALNLKREYFRRKGRRPEAPLDLDGRTDPSEGPYDPLLKERAYQVRQALSALPEGQREVIALHWLEEMPFSEVAVAVGASVTAVKVRAHRGYERLRKTLAERPDPQEIAAEANQAGAATVPAGGETAPTPKNSR